MRRSVVVGAVASLVAALLSVIASVQVVVAPAALAGGTLDSYVAAHPAGSTVGNGQCVALVNGYLSSVYGFSTAGQGVNYASDMAYGKSGAHLFSDRGWTWSTDANPGDFHNGDVFVWSYSAGSTAGHTAIWYNGKLYEQNAHSPGLTISLDSWSWMAGATYAGRWIPPGGGGGGGGSAPSPNGGTAVTSDGSGRCLDVVGAGTANGTTIDIYDCNGTAAQQWAWVAGTVRVYGSPTKCMDADANGIGFNGTRIQVWDCLAGSANQQWIAYPDGSLRSAASGRCLDVTGGSTANGTALQLFDCNGTAAQRWTGFPTPNQGGGLLNTNSGRCVDVPGAAISPSTQLQLFDCNGSGAQQWKQVGRTVHVYLDKCLDVRGGNAVPGTAVQLFGCNGTAAQDWTFGSDGTVKNSGLCLDATGAATGNGTALQVFTCNGTAAQSWRWTTTPTVHMTAPRSPFTLASSARVSWTGTDVGSAIADYQLRFRASRWNGSFGVFSYPAGWTALSSSYVTATGLAPGTDYCYSVRARDTLGTFSTWSGERCVAVALDDRSIYASSAWSRLTASYFWKSTITSTRVLNAVMTRPSARLDRLAVVVTKCSTCGTLGVYIGSTLIARLSLLSTSSLHRVLVTLPRFSYRTGTVYLKSLTSTKYVQVDGLGISRS